MAYENILVERDPTISTLTVNRPKALNALNSQTLRELTQAVRDCADSRVIILTGAGDKAFVAGADISEMAPMGPWKAREFSELGHVLTALIEDIPAATIAAVNGYALGGGLELALAADFRVAGERARVGQPEILLGVIPGAGGTQRLPRLVGPAKAKDIVFSGRMVTAAEALQIGLVDQVVPDDSVYQAALDMVQRYASGPALALRAAKQAIDAGLGADLATGLEIERVQFAALFGTEDQEAGMRSFLENGPGKATFTGR